MVYIYDTSRLIGTAPSWQIAVSTVKDLAHADGVEGGLGWYRTANRNCFERGRFRAIGELQQRFPHELRGQIS